MKRIALCHQQFIQENRYLPLVRDMRQLGTILAIEINQSGATSYFHEARNSLYYYFLDRNILLRPLGNVLYIVPPYIITDEELVWIYQELINLLKG